MTRYKCRICDATFDEPAKDRYDGAETCPFCLAPYFDELDLFPCSVCGGDKPDGDVLCKECGQKISAKVRTMLDGLDINEDEDAYLVERISEYGLNDFLEG